MTVLIRRTEMVNIVTLIVRRADGRLYGYIEGEGFGPVSKAFAETIVSGSTKLKADYIVELKNGFAEVLLGRDKAVLKNNLIARDVARRPRKSTL
jgi:hypothetical protein